MSKLVQPIDLDKIPAYAHNGQYIIWCEHEDRWHYHGASEGARAAHCNCPRSPLRDGYRLVLTPGLDEHPERKKVDKWPRMSDGSCRNAECRELARREKRMNGLVGMRRNKKLWDLTGLSDRTGSVELKNGVTLSRATAGGPWLITQDGKTVLNTKNKRDMLETLYVKLGAV